MTCIEENEYITLSEVKGKVFLKVKKEGFQLKKFEEITKRHPRFRVSNFMLLKKTINKVSEEPIEIGDWNDRIEIEVSADSMQALISIYETPDYIQDNIIEVQEAVQKLLKEHGIIYGIKPLDVMSFKQGKPMVIAQGTPPTKGENAKITYLKQAEKKPMIDESGKADFFDMNFIVEIKEGSWLGEKIPAKEGEPGRNIFGENIPALKGEDIPLKYDKATAYEVEEAGKTVIRSKTKGIINEVNGLLTVQKHLVIDGDVGLQTGNLTFDGSIQIRGTIMPGYSVVASGDISVESKEGVNQAELIKSAEGDIFIKGGIFGKGRTKVEAHGNIFIKHANECFLSAKGTVHIGYYALGTDIEASEVKLDERKGKIIGGKTVAINSIVTAYTGNSMERKTELIVQGLDRKILTDHTKSQAQLMMTKQTEVANLETKLEQLSRLKVNMTVQQIAMYEQTKQQYNMLKQEVKEIDNELKRVLEILKQHNEYYIEVTKEANGGTVIQIGNKSTVLSRPTKGKFKLENGELNV